MNLVEQKEEMKIDVFEVFSMGIDYGQLLMEQERDQEDLCDAFQGAIIDAKYSMPSQIAPRRMPHSKEWREAKAASLHKFMELIVKVKTSNEKITAI